MIKTSKLSLVLIGHCFLIFWILTLTYFVFGNLDRTNKISANIDSANAEKQKIQTMKTKLIALSGELLTIRLAVRFSTVFGLFPRLILFNNNYMAKRFKLVPPNLMRP